MPVKIIHVSRDGILIDDRSRPIVVLPPGLFKSILDASTCSGLGIDALSAAADEAKAKNLKNGKRIVSAKGALHVKWPPLALIKAHPAFKEYKIVRAMASRVPVAAKPCTVHMKLGSGKHRAFQIHYRTMTACKTLWGLTTPQFEAITAKHPGYTSLLPAGVTRIVVHAPGWTPPAGGSLLTALNNPGPIWDCRILKGGRVEATVIGGNPLIFPSVVDTHQGVLNNARWL